MPEPERIAQFLSRRSIQAVLRVLTKKGADGKCVLEKIIAAYGRPETGILDRIRFAIPFLLVDHFRKKIGVTRERVVERICEHTPTARAVVNTARGIGKYGLIEPQTFSAPLMVVWNFTQACNFSCKHCYQDARYRLEDELTRDEQIRIVEEMAENDVPFLAFSGGEPLMSKTFWPVAERASALGLHLTLATNGSLIDEGVAKRLADLSFKYVQISVDSIDSAKHDRFRGSPGYWERAVSGIKHSVAAGLKVGLSATITRLNVEEVEELVAFAKELGCHNFYAFNLVPTGRGKDIVDLDITPQMREQVLSVLRYHLVKHDIAMMSTAPQLGRTCMQLAAEDGVFNTGHYGAGGGLNTVMLAKYVGGCGAGRCYCGLQPNGVVTPCVFMPLPVGDLRRQRLKEIWEHSEVFKLLRDRDDREGHCLVCDYKYHCGGCRARSYGYFGDLRKPDPGCINNLEYWEQLQDASYTEAEIAAGE